jgi:hypothetical protein
MLGARYFVSREVLLGNRAEQGPKVTDRGLICNKVSITAIIVSKYQ